MEWDGKRWISADRNWAWDGSRWIPTTSTSAIAGSSWAAVSVGFWIARLFALGQGVGTIGTGLLTWFLGLLILVAGAKWWWLAGLFALIGMGALGVGAFLAWSVAKLGPHHPRWNFGIFILEIPLIPLGLFLIVLEASYSPGSPQNPGTDGPFADGGNGLLALLGLAWTVGGVATILILIWEELLRFLRSPRRNRLK